MKQQWVVAAFPSTRMVMPGLEAPNFEQNTNYTGTINCCISLIGSDGFDVNALNEWATAPAFSHVAVTLDEAELEVLFAELAANIFNSVCLPVRVLNRNFSFSIPPKHPATNWLDYSDTKGNIVIFPKPMAEGECGVVVHPEPCRFR